MSPAAHVLSLPAKMEFSLVMKTPWKLVRHQVYSSQMASTVLREAPTPQQQEVTAAAAESTCLMHHNLFYTLSMKTVAAHHRRQHRRRPSLCQPHLKKQKTFNGQRQRRRLPLTNGETTGQSWIRPQSGAPETRKDWRPNSLSM